jgi:hypothetical protein
MAVAFSIAFVGCTNSHVPHHLAGDAIKALFFADAILINRTLISSPSFPLNNPNCKTSPCESALYRRRKLSHPIGPPIAF